jgi:hypothetical protein
MRGGVRCGRRAPEEGQRLRRPIWWDIASVRTRSAAAATMTQAWSTRATSGDRGIHPVEGSTGAAGRSRIRFRRTDSQSGEQVSWRP